MSPVSEQLGGADYDEVTVTIATAASLSSAADIGGGKFVGIVLPTIESASITFQASSDGSTYSNLYNTDGTTETALGASTGARAVALPAAVNNWSSIKVRSGTSGSAVTVSATRTIKLVVQRIASAS